MGFDYSLLFVFFLGAFDFATVSWCLSLCFLVLRK